MTMTMNKNKVILNEVKFRETQDYTTNYKEIYEYLLENIEADIYNEGFRNYLHYILMRFDIIPATKNFPSTLEVAFDLYIEKNRNSNNKHNLTDSEFKGFIFELENFDDVFYEVIYDHNKMYRTYGSGNYEFIINLYYCENKEDTAMFIDHTFKDYPYEIINIFENVAVIRIPVDGKELIFADLEILLYYALDSEDFGTYTYERLS